MPPTSPWSGFCEGLEHYSPSLCLGSQYEEYLEEKSEDIFSSDISIRISDLSEGPQGKAPQAANSGFSSTVRLTQAPANCRSQLFSSASEICSHLEHSPEPLVRIISIYSKFSLDPLQINAELLKLILQRYSVPIEFLDVFLSFGDGPAALEGCNSHVCRIRNGEKQDIAYEMKYYERNRRGGVNPWSLRHTGVLHCRRQNMDLFIVLQPLPDHDSVFENRLLGLKASEIRAILVDPLRIHALILTSYLSNWRPYLQFVGDQFEERKDHALVTILGGESFEDSKEGFEAVRDLHGLQDTVSMAKACCQSYARIFAVLQDCGATPPLLDIIQYQIDSLEGFSKSLTSVQRRIDNATTLQGYAVNLRYQAQANKLGSKMAEMNEEVRDLAKSAQKDSAFITVITILSAIYIPGSFVATIFGTNFFAYNPVSQSLNIASNFWIFVAAWLPLTGITILIFCMVIWWNAWLHRKSVRWPWKEIPRRRKQHCEKSTLLTGA